jgi:hypothetical protein
MKRKLKTWRGPLFVLATTVVLLTSLFVIPTVFAKIGVNLDQFQNGKPVGTGANWANGSINAQNSAYNEGNSVPYRYFVTGVEAASSHFFTIQMEYSKGGKAAFDYPTSFDRSYAAGLRCSPISTSVPADCGQGGDLSAQFPDPDGSVPGGYLSFDPNVPDNQRLLTAYNVTSLTVGSYVLAGPVGDQTLSISVQFTANNAGSVGLFWGGHLARATDWGGFGASSISGAPFHMRGINLDDGGKTNQDRSIQPGAVLPEAGCGIVPIGAVCGGNDTTYSSPGTAAGATYDWSITGNGVFVTDGVGGTSTTTSNQSTTTVVVRAGASGSFTLNLTTNGSGFESQSCELTVIVNARPVAAITSDSSACGPASLTASATGDETNDTYAWTTLDGVIPAGEADDKTIHPTVTGTYKVVITRAANNITCASNEASATVCFAPVVTIN